MTIWTFFTRGGWILPVALLAAGWVHSEKARARAEGIAEQMASQSHRDRQRFDSAVRADSVYKVAAAARVARLVKDSTENDQARQLLAIAVSGASQRADSVAAEIRVKFPELAAQVAVLLAARDTARIEAMAERNGRLNAESLRAECELAKANAERLLGESKRLVADQGDTIKQLQKVVGSWHGLSLIELILVATGVGIGTAVLAGAAF